MRRVRIGAGNADGKKTEGEKASGYFVHKTNRRTLTEKCERCFACAYVQVKL